MKLDRKQRKKALTQDEVRSIQTAAVKKTIEAVKSRGTRNAYSCMISGEIHETYTIKGTAFEEIVKELT